MILGRRSARACLLDDGGAAASDPAHFFRSPQFLRAEGVTHTLDIEGREALQLPVIVRQIPDTVRFDAASPYGYPGASAVPDRPPRPGKIDWSESELVSVFLRDRIGDDPCLEGGTIRSQVHIVDPRAEGGVRKRLREQIRRNERRGWEVEAMLGPDVNDRARAGFERAYAETMTRTDASERYLYPSEYFREVLSSHRAWLLLAVRDGAEPQAGAIAVRSDGYLHYYLGGTTDAALEDSPMKNLFAGMISLAEQEGLPLNLGGGVTPGDSLDSFKRGFANASAAFRTHEVICDRNAYVDLSLARPAPPGKLQREGVAMEDPGEPRPAFFPAYRT